MADDLEACDQAHVDDASADDDGVELTQHDFSTDGFGTAALRPGGAEWSRKLAYRFRHVKETFDKMRKEETTTMMKSDENPDAISRWRQLREEVESSTDSWLTKYGWPCLAETTRRNLTVNVALTSSKLVTACANILVRGVGDVFSAENVYSSSRIGKEACLERVINRFGGKTTFVVLGKSGEDEEAAKNLDLPFWKVETEKDFANLKVAMDMQLI